MLRGEQITVRVSKEVESMLVGRWQSMGEGLGGGRFEVADGWQKVKALE